MHSSWKPREKCGYSTRSETRNPDAWLKLLAAATAGGKGWLEALQHAGCAESLLSMSRAARRAAGLSRKAATLLDSSAAKPPDAWQVWLAAPGHSLHGIDSRHYPDALKQTADAPLALWVDGRDPELLNNPQLAIVGSRHPTANGRMAARTLAAELSSFGITITSGLAQGIDSASHEGALDGPGGTVAVLGNGIDRIYPARNRKLAQSIREKGLIVSEYAPAVPVRAYQFPRRNRIIAGLSLGTLVVEATRRSGSLITARLALDFGREVYAVPGSIHNAMSKGCHKLLREGAGLVEETSDILVEIAPQLRASAGVGKHERNDEKSAEMPAELADCLDHAPIAFDALLAASGLTTAKLSSMLLHLELQGKIEALPGGRYCRLAKRS